MNFLFFSSFFKAIFLLLFLGASTLWAQIPYNPHGNYLSIETEHYEIIYLSGMDSIANRIAHLMEFSYAANSKSLTLPLSPGKTQVILQSRNQQANAYVAFVPFYASFYNGQIGLAGLPWYETLALHEGRHVVQGQHMRKGDTKEIFYWIFGDFPIALIEGLLVPVWFSEGDAVLMETLLSQGGRGRRAFFTMDLRALDLENKRMSYYQNYLGKDDDERFLANPYEIGYLMTTAARRRFGSKVWNQTTQHTGEYLFLPTFDFSLNRATDGTDITDLYDATLDELHPIWEEQLRGLTFSELRLLSQTPSDLWSARLQPEYFNNQLHFIHFDKTRGSFIATLSDEKEGQIKNLHPIPARIIRNYTIAEKPFTFAAGKWAWIDKIPDIRWDSESHTDIYLYDTQTDEETKLTTEGKFINIGFSKDGTTLLAHLLDENHIEKIALVDAQTGALLKAANVSGYFYDIRSTFDGRFVAARLNSLGFSIVEIDPVDLSVRNLIAPTHREALRSPLLYEDYLIYQSDLSGIDQIWAKKWSEGSIYQIATVKYGAFFPTVHKGQLIFSNYNTQGYDLVSTPIAPTHFTSLDSVKIAKENYFEPLLQQEPYSYGIDSLDKFQSPLPSKPNPYSPLLRSPHIHSRGFSYTPNEASLILMQRDPMGILNGSLSGGYNWKQKSGIFKGELTYSQLYPEITGFGSYQFVDYINDSPKDTLLSTQKSAGLSLGIPFNFSRGLWYRYLQFKSSVAYSSVSNERAITDVNFAQEGKAYTLDHLFQLQMIRESPRLAVGPRWGLYLTGGISHTFASSDWNSLISWGIAQTYLPGLWWTHNLTLTAGYEKEHKDIAYRFSVGSPRAQGALSALYADYFYARALYKFPLIHTSLHIWKLFYLRQINGLTYSEYGFGNLVQGHSENAYVGGGFELPANLFSNLAIIVAPTLMFNWDLMKEESFISLGLTVFL